MKEIEITLGAIVSAIKFIVHAGGKAMGFSAKTKKQWFDDHIEPSYRQLTVVNRDYTAQFSKALDSLREGEDLEEVVRILKSGRLNKLLRRQEVSESLIALRDYRLKRRRQPPVVLVFYDYVSAVDGYLNAASPLPRETWYTYFIDTFAELVERGEDPMSYDYPACSEGRDAPRLAAEQLNLAVQVSIPEAFKRVQAYYAKLRAECLSDV